MYADIYPKANIFSLYSKGQEQNTNSEVISKLYLIFCIPDNIKTKEKLIGKKKKKKMKLLEKTPDETLDDFFEDAPPLDLNASFYQMNLSRPLLKVNFCDKPELKF